MKKAFIFIFFSMLLSNFVLAQTAVLTQTSCNSVKVTLTGGCANGYEGQGYFSPAQGRWFLNAYHNYTYKVTLVKVTGGSIPYPEVTYRIESGNTTQWTNLEEGATFRVIVTPYLCTNVPASTVAGQNLGFISVLGNTFSSNDVVMGTSRVQDNSWLFIPASGFSIGNNSGLPPVYTPSNTVKIDASASKNYDRFFLSISETLPNGTQGRWRALGNNGNGGWQFEQIGIRDLTAIWADNSGWTFNPYHTYKVQIAISKNSCPSWTEVIKSFIVCPDGTFGCRIGSDIIDKISISPNPTSNKFQLNGVDFSAGQNYQVTVSDISGKTLVAYNDVKTNEFDTNKLPNGLYIVKLSANNSHLYSSKLIVNK